MENKIILDSNIFVAFYFENDSLHNDALKIMQEIVDFTIILPYCVIQEVSTILTYRIWKHAADTFLEDIKLASNIILVDNNLTEEIDFFGKIKNKISFTDVSLIHLSLKFNALLITFDKQLLSIANKF